MQDDGSKLNWRQHASNTGSEDTEIDVQTTGVQLALELMHEIKNPLEVLGHLTYLTLEEKNDPGKVERYMLLAAEQMKMLTGIASQTLACARVSDSPKPVDLVGLAEAALRIHQRRIEAKKIHLVKDLPRDW